MNTTATAPALTEDPAVTALTVLETLQTVLGLVDDQFGEGSLDKLLAEMKFHADMEIDGAAGQLAIATAVAASDHVQAGW